MKKILLLFCVLLTWEGAVMAQQYKTDVKEAREAEKQNRKANRETRKAIEKMENQLLYEQALQAVKDKDFVLEANRVEFKRGHFVNVSYITNFISLKGNRATIQLSLSNAISGPNGLGGITVEGSVSEVEMKPEKRGNIHVGMMVQGVGVSAYVSFVLVKDSNRCSVNVNPNFNGNRITFVGILRPTDQSNVYKGRSL